ncbi:helix-turn-helix domain-containing protein [Paracoccus panacisoli]|uniref:Helix-turn-helix domain-containing protein n=1 Tax=Paracoccus panacisoli TaxID=1510163 RepID=A0ABV6TC46_9RHOB
MTRSLRTPAHHALRALLKRHRVEAQLTQAQLAARMGRPQSFVAKIESGERRLDVVEFLEYSTALGSRATTIIDELECAPTSR